MPAGGLQSHTWELQWGPQGLEYATKRIGMNPVITQNFSFSTDPMGRILSMTYNGPSYNGELYFHYDVQGNTSLLTDSNGSPVASFRYDLHNGRIAASWNPANLEIVNMKNGRQGSVTLTSAIGYLPDWGIDLTVQPWKPIIARNDWGFINIRHDSTEPGDDDELDNKKDCGDVECDLENCQKDLLDSNNRMKEFEATEYNCKYIKCCHDLWRKTRDDLLQKGDEYMSKWHELLPYDEDLANYYLVQSFNASMFALVYNRFAWRAYSWLLDNIHDCLNLP